MYKKVFFWVGNKGKVMGRIILCRVTYIDNRWSSCLWGGNGGLQRGITVYGGNRGSNISTGG